MSPSPVRRDTRQHARVDLEVMVSVFDTAQRWRKPIRFPSTDLSSGGAFLRADVLFEVGEVLLVEFKLPNGRQIRAQGRVVRVTRGGIKDRVAGMGIEFLDLSADDRAAIDTRSS
ncbi:MAG TPA: PilZ domain-containing protein [Polyangia bacterium]|nr:PilZ domain-containing protein [Polyangia bacterium]